MKMAITVKGIRGVELSALYCINGFLNGSPSVINTKKSAGSRAGFVGNSASEFLRTAVMIQISNMGLILVMDSMSYCTIALHWVSTVMYPAT